jgi:hypothetical protein
MTELLFFVQNSSQFDARITGVGFNLPGDLTDFRLNSTTSPSFTLSNDVSGIPGLASSTLDFALLTGRSFATGNPAAGIAPGDTVSFRVVGPFPPSFGFERVLDFLVVRFEQVGPTGTLSGVGFGPSAATVPEPAMTVLFGVGLSVYGMRRRLKG